MARVAELDSVRGLAALSVVFYHLWFPRWFHGWTRVEVFFVLSGYLLTSRWLRKSGQPGFHADLVLRRVFRIVPAYLAALAALLAYRWLGSSTFPLDGLPYYLGFLQNTPAWWGCAVPAFSPRFFHTWSLALDVQFYALWLLLLAWGGRLLLVPAALMLVVIAPLGRCLGVSEFILPGRCDGFGAGALVAAAMSDPARVARHSWRLRAAFAGLLGCGLALVALGMVREWDRLTGRAVPWPGVSILGVVLVYAGGLGWLLHASGGPRARWLRCRSLGYLGTISYGLYLYHLPVFAILEPTARAIGLDRGWGLDAIAIVASLAVAALSWELLERPLLASVNRVRASRTGAAGRFPAPRGEPSVPRLALPTRVASG